MFKKITITILMFSLIVLSSQASDDISLSKIVSNQVTAIVQVNMPNFNILDETNEKVITVIHKAAIPAIYSGTLLQLKSEDLTDIERAATNLNIEKIILYGADAKIANELAQKGFNIELRK